jgi:hypothetical protein
MKKPKNISFYTTADQWQAKEFAADLISRGQWFTCEPQPYGMFRFEVKTESGLPQVPWQEAR